VFGISGSAPVQLTEEADRAAKRDRIVQGVPARRVRSDGGDLPPLVARLGLSGGDPNAW